MKESENNEKLCRGFNCFYFSIILSILYIAVIESKAIGRYFR